MHDIIYYILIDMFYDTNFNMVQEMKQVELVSSNFDLIYNTIEWCDYVDFYIESFIDSFDFYLILWSFLGEIGWSAWCYQVL